MTAVDPKQIARYFSSKDKFMWGSVENRNPGAAITASYVQVPHTAREGEPLQRGGKEVERATVNKNFSQ